MRGRRLERTGGVAYYTRPPQARRSAEHAEAKTRSFPREYVEDIFGPRATQMPADRLPQ
jgi:hypothetical protein